MELKYAGQDERIALRNQAKISAAEFEGLRNKLAGYEHKDAWTRQTLELIAKKPATLAAKLAKSVNLETQFFKRHVRQLKELGLTESLEVGYPAWQGLFEATEQKANSLVQEYDLTPHFFALNV